MDDLNTLRNAIDDIDDQLIQLLEQRFALSKTIGTLKKSTSTAVTNPKREQEILTKIQSRPFCEEITQLYQTLFILSKKLQRNR